MKYAGLPVQAHSPSSLAERYEIPVLNVDSSA